METNYFVYVTGDCTGRMYLHKVKDIRPALKSLYAYIHEHKRYDEMWSILGYEDDIRLDPESGEITSKTYPYSLAKSKYWGDVYCKGKKVLYRVAPDRFFDRGVTRVWEVKSDGHFKW